MIYPLLPFFLTNVLRAGPAFLGLVEGVAESTLSLLKLASGWFSDRLGKRKTLVVIGYGIASVLRPFMAIARAPWQVLAIRFGDRVGKGIRTAPRDALIADSVAPEHCGAAFGYHCAADHAGAVLGPLAATLVLLLRPGSIGSCLRSRPCLLCSACSCSVRGFAMSVTAPRRRKRSSADQRPGHTLLHLPRHRARVHAGNATDAFLLLRAQQLGVPLALIPILWSAFHVSKMIWNIIGGRLADRLGPRPAIVSGWLVYALTYGGFILATRAWQVWALFGVYGLFYGLTEAPEKALVAAAAPADRRGAAFGAYHFSIGLAALPASLLFGLLWQEVSIAAAFATGAGLALAAAAGLLFLPQQQKS